MDDSAETQPLTPWDDPAFAQNWNDTYGLSMERAPVRAKFVYPLLEKYIGDFDGKILTDLGCGNGNLIRRFHDRPFAAWHGIDSGRAILQSAKAAFDDPRIHFTHMDVTGVNLHLPPSDIVTGIFVIEEIPDARIIDFFRNAARALKPDGTALFFTNHPAYALLQDHQNNGTNTKFKGHRGYFDTDASEYSLSVMNGRNGLETKVAYHHKPLGRIFKTAMAAGLVLNDILEIPAGVDNLRKLATRTPQQGDYPRFLFLAFRPKTP